MASQKSSSGKSKVVDPTLDLKLFIGCVTWGAARLQHQTMQELVGWLINQATKSEKEEDSHELSKTLLTLLLLDSEEQKNGERALCELMTIAFEKIILFGLK